MKKVSFSLVAVLFSLWLSGCMDKSTQEDPMVSNSTEQLSGEVFYRERIMLPPDSELTVQLLDVSIADAKSVTLAESKEMIQGGPPYAFSLSYDPTGIDERMQYSLRAQITRDGQLLMTSDTALNPFREPAPWTINLVSVSAKHNAAEVAGAANLKAIVSVDPLVELENTYWKILTLGETDVVVVQNEREPHMMLRGDDRGVTGTTGCNSFTGTYTTNGNELTFGPLASTKKMCMQGMEQEQLIMQTLSETQHFSINQHNMTLFDKQMLPIATMTAVHFN